jgi:S1-C subfamily serine protease
LNLPARASGFIVKTVAKNSPGDHAGLRGGISMTPANSVKTRDMISGLSPGPSYKVSVLRAGQVLELIGKAP